jgi:hypothetical protein
MEHAANMPHFYFLDQMVKIITQLQNYEKKVEQRGFVAASPEIFTNDEGYFNTDRNFFDGGYG